MPDDTEQTAAPESSEADPFGDALEGAHLIALATILSVGRSPGRWSDFALSLQPVKLRLDEILRGELSPDAEIEVGFVVIEGSPMADAHEPKLHPDLFTIGQQRVVFLYQEGDHWTSWDELYGALPVEELPKVREQLGL